MSHFTTGREGNYEWLECPEAEFDIHMLLTRCPESVLGKCIVVTSFDSGPLKASPAEIEQGWIESGDLLMVPTIEDVTFLPYDNYDEWYVFPNREMPAIADTFVNYCGFTLRSPNMIFEENVSAMGEQADIVGEKHFAERLEELQRRYWEQIIRTNPESYIACGDRFLFVTRSNQVFAAVRDAVVSSRPVVNTNIRVGPQTAKFDRDATAALYRDTITTAGADDCNCTYCKNFAAQRTAAYPLHFLELLERIGADPRKELEVFNLERAAADSTRRLYGGWFAFCGTITSGADWRPDWRPEHTPEAFTYWTTNSFPNAGLPEGVCAIEFLCELPWVISEPPEQSGTH